MANNDTAPKRSWDKLITPEEKQKAQYVKSVLIPNSIPIVSLAANEAYTDYDRETEMYKQGVFRGLGSPQIRYNTDGVFQSKSVNSHSGEIIVIRDYTYIITQFYDETSTKIIKESVHFKNFAVSEYFKTL